VPLTLGSGSRRITLRKVPTSDGGWRPSPRPLDPVTGDRSILGGDHGSAGWCSRDAHAAIVFRLRSSHI
jgi:hypothetical protein